MSKSSYIPFIIGLIAVFTICCLAISGSFSTTLREGITNIPMKGTAVAGGLSGKPRDCSYCIWCDSSWTDGNCRPDLPMGGGGCADEHSYLCGNFCADVGCGGTTGDVQDKWTSRDPPQSNAYTPCKYQLCDGCPIIQGPACTNGGYCSGVGGTWPTGNKGCQCPPGFGGDTCEKKIPYAPCSNLHADPISGDDTWCWVGSDGCGGMQMPPCGLDGTSGACTPGKQSTPCRNGGKCIGLTPDGKTLPGGNTCDCVYPWTGPTCETISTEWCYGSSKLGILTATDGTNVPNPCKKGDVCDGTLIETSCMGNGCNGAGVGNLQCEPGTYDKGGIFTPGGKTYRPSVPIPVLSPDGNHIIMDGAWGTTGWKMPSKVGMPGDYCGDGTGFPFTYKDSMTGEDKNLCGPGVPRCHIEFPWAPGKIMTRDPQCPGPQDECYWWRFQCICPPGYTGTQCQTPTGNTGGSSPPPSGNGGPLPSGSGGPPQSGGSSPPPSGNGGSLPSGNGGPPPSGSGGPLPSGGSSPSHHPAMVVLYHQEAVVLHHPAAVVLYHQEAVVLHHPAAVVLYHQEAVVLHHPAAVVLYHQEAVVLHHPAMLVAKFQSEGRIPIIICKLQDLHTTARRDNNGVLLYKNAPY